MVETLGQKRMVLNYTTPTQEQKDLAFQIKVKTAELIDLLQAIKNDEVSKTYNESPQVLQEVSGEKLRWISIAQTEYETGAMYAVKAIFN